MKRKKLIREDFGTTPETPVHTPATFDSQTTPEKIEVGNQNPEPELDGPNRVLDLAQHWMDYGFKYSTEELIQALNMIKNNEVTKSSSGPGPHAGEGIEGGGGCVKTALNEICNENSVGTTAITPADEIEIGIQPGYSIDEISNNIA
jgi:hypothetical protein